MKTKAISVALVAALGFGSLAHANEFDRNDYSDRNHQRGEWRHQDGQRAERWQRQQQREEWQRQAPRPEWRGQQWEGRSWDHRAYNRVPQYTARPYVHQAPRPYYRGGYLPYEYRSQRYWVNDWHGRHLAPPPYGHQWVQTDAGDLVLVALATGLIANLILAQ